MNTFYETCRQIVINKTSETDEVYHVTRLSFLESIAKEGLKPSKLTCDTPEYTADVVCASFDPDIMLYWAAIKIRELANSGVKDGVIGIAINVDTVNGNSISVDPVLYTEPSSGASIEELANIAESATQTFAYKDVISPDRISVITPDGNIPISDIDFTKPLNPAWCIDTTFNLENRHDLIGD